MLHMVVSWIGQDDVLGANPESPGRVGGPIYDAVKQLAPDAVYLLTDFLDDRPDQVCEAISPLVASPENVHMRTYTLRYPGDLDMIYKAMSTTVDAIRGLEHRSVITALVTSGTQFTALCWGLVAAKRDWLKSIINTDDCGLRAVDLPNCDI